VTGVEAMAKRVRVSGRVQGVFFRASTQREARRLGLVGWVRNRSDGSVEVHVEGAPEAVQELTRWLRSGPPLAEVRDLELTDAPAEGIYDEFDVRR
jgi:acylphosphatase